MQTAAQMWQTARTAEGGYTRDRGNPDAQRLTLEGQAKQWPTPAAQNWKGSSDASITRTDGKSRMDLLHYRAEQGFTRPAPETPPRGPMSLPQIRLARLLLRAAMSPPPRSVSRPWCPPRRRKPRSSARAAWRSERSFARWSAKRRALWASRRLSPGFVSWLMGWPTGHALCACSETEFARWRQDMRGALSALPMASGPWIWMPPAETPAVAQLQLI